MKQMLRDWFDDSVSLFEVFGWFLVVFLVADEYVSIWIPLVLFIIWEAIYFIVNWRLNRNKE